MKRLAITLFFALSALGAYAQHDSTHGDRLVTIPSTAADYSEIDATKSNFGTGTVRGPVGYLKVLPPPSGCRAAVVTVSHDFNVSIKPVSWSDRPCTSSNCYAYRDTDQTWNVRFRINGVAVNAPSIGPSGQWCSNDETGQTSCSETIPYSGAKLFTASTNICAGQTTMRIDFPEYNGRIGNAIAGVFYHVQ